MNTARRTKRRYAHELYPHATEGAVRPLDIEVPYLYARVVGYEVTGTGWNQAPKAEFNDRLAMLTDAQQIALMADALLQGKAGQDAWAWMQRGMRDQNGLRVAERIQRHVPNWQAIKPYPCGPAKGTHEHHGEPDARGWHSITSALGPEDECDDCTEEVAPC